MNNIKVFIHSSFDEANQISLSFFEQMHASGIEIERVIERCPETKFGLDDKGAFLFPSSDSSAIRLNWVRDYIVLKRKNKSSGKGPLFKAVRFKNRAPKLVIDATMGTGKDTILLLSFGMKVEAFERNPAVFALGLWEYLTCLADESYGELFSQNLKINFGELRSAIKEYPNESVCYFDPMYETKEKSALARKEMETFKQIVGKDLDQVEILEELIEVYNVVVVKRALKSDKLLERGSVVSFSGKTTRYDRYFR